MINIEKARKDMDEVANKVMGGNMTDFPDELANHIIDFYAKGIINKEQAEVIMTGADEGEVIEIKGGDGNIYRLDGNEQPCQYLHKQ